MRLKFLSIYIYFLIIVLNIIFEDISSIKSNPNFYWGEATSSDPKQAQDMALAMLIEKIQVTVSSSFENTTAERRENDQRTFEEMTRGFIRSYATQTLREVQTVQKLTENGQLYVFRYISKEAVQQLFKEREELVKTLVKEAEYAAEQFNYSYALKYYYNALILMNSIPHALEPYEGYVLSVEIPKRINQLMDTVDFRFDDDNIISEQEREIILEVRALGQPLKQLSFTFWDGNQLVEAEAKDGFASIRLFGASTELSELRCSPIYSFYASRNQIDALATVWDAMPEKPSFPKSKVVSLESTFHKNEVIENKYLTLELADSMELESSAMDQLSNELAMLTHSDTKDTIELDTDLLNKWELINQFNSVSFSSKKNTALIQPTWSDLEVREIPVTNVYATLGMQTTEYLIPDATKEGHLYDVNYGVIKGLYDEVKEQSMYGEDWKERHVLIKFLERYRTAFLTRDLETINQIFADEARIIVGRKIRPGESTGQQYNYRPEGKNQPNYRYVELKKKQYLQNLEDLFSRVPDIYAGYTSFQILRKNNLPGTYGVSMRQNYQSTGYADEGYLFLLIDFNHSEPQIMVRSWQPQEWREDALIELSDFKVYK